MPRNFADYSLSELRTASAPEMERGVYSLADELIPEIAEAANYELPVTPDEVALSGLITRLGPEKELQKNIGAVLEALGADSTRQVADWIERSGIMFPVERSFAEPLPFPERVDAIVWSGGVARWMLRRLVVTQSIDPKTVGRVILPVGNRVMGSAEHQLVDSYAQKYGEQPTESEFVDEYILDALRHAGFDARLLPVDSANGDAVLDELFSARPELLDGNIAVVANAPNAIQSAGQLRLAARRAGQGFDNTGDQLFMISDSISLARRGESPRTHQNPITALGQLVRNALFLQRNL